MSKKVLVIESNRFVRDFLVECLKSWGYESETTTKIPESCSDYNFIIADYITIRELNLIENISEIASDRPVIITSTINCPQDEVLKEKAFCIEKPFSVNEFKEILKIADEGFHKELL
ncbi:hypothetical protein [Thermodesulfovibrio yellowstonii]|uniref:Response regulatory domain-containing protein n=1 Tax=Thermodesulfovibrio yellowstonii TaxID=28262 RepID=A0A9W6LL41_9BACT|nr:hypothetical protein [Thermodesulfovibrio islandicus]GLI54304.1 hypothetical protein TISLANDTSLP1_19970 [Thermodesulfovibrio islandicus]